MAFFVSFLASLISSFSSIFSMTFTAALASLSEESLFFGLFDIIESNSFYPEQESLFSAGHATNGIEEMAFTDDTNSFSFPVAQLSVLSGQERCDAPEVDKKRARTVAEV